MKNKRSPDIDTINKSIRNDILKFKPKHQLGQNFIFDEIILSQIADACGIQLSQSVLEIGSGPGTLTHELLQNGACVLGVEIDQGLISIAKKNLHEYADVTFLCEDILQVDIPSLCNDDVLTPPYIAVGNIPYYITQPILQKLLRANPQPEKIILMTQKELGERIVGGKKKESFLSLLVQIYGSATKIFDLPANAFWPIPKVNSSLIAITPISNKKLSEPFILDLLTVIKIGFSAPRKQIHNVFKMSLEVDALIVNSMLDDNQIPIDARAQHLSLESWTALTKSFQIKLPDILNDIRNVY